MLLLAGCGAAPTATPTRLLVITQAPTVEPSPTATPTSAGIVPLPAGWTRHHQAGFTIDVPAGWDALDLTAPDSLQQANALGAKFPAWDQALQQIVSNPNASDLYAFDPVSTEIAGVNRVSRPGMTFHQLVDFVVASRQGDTETKVTLSQVTLPGGTAERFELRDRKNALVAIEYHWLIGEIEYRLIIAPPASGARDEAKIAASFSVP